MKAISIARKTLLELWREPLLLGLLFVFPIMLVWLYDIAFGQTDQGLSKFLKLLVSNQDSVATTSSPRFSDELVQSIRQIQFEGQPVFELTLVSDENAALNTLREHKAAMLLVIPPDFTSTLTRFVQGATSGAPVTIKLVGDPTSDNFVFARSFLEGLVNEFSRQAVNMPPSQVINYQFIPGTGTTSDFDFGVPGVIVFGIMLLVASTAMTMVRENVAGTLKRLRLTRLGARDLLLGVTLAQMVVALAVVPATLGVALALGFKSHGSLLLAITIGLLLSLAAVGLGLVVACFARSDSEAANLGASLGVLMVLISPSMYAVPNVPIAAIAGHTIQIYDIFPTTHASEAMRRVLILGDGLVDISYELVWLLGLSIMLLVIGVWLYQRLQMRNT
jgi:ABC-2 type transport system permease protein